MSRARVGHRGAVGGRRHLQTRDAREGHETDLGLAVLGLDEGDGRLLRNVSVLGPIAELDTWVRRYGVRKVIIALPSANHAVRRRVAELCAAAHVEALTVPAYEDLISGRTPLTTVRMAAEVLRTHGWLVTFLGASTPADHLRRFVDEVGAIGVVVSCSVPIFLSGALRSVQAAQAAGVPVLAGGRAFGPDDLRARRLGADGWAPDAVAAGRLLE